MARPRTVDRERVLAVYAEIGEIRHAARVLGIHEQTVRSILKASRGQCRGCDKPAANGKTKCSDCARKQREEMKTRSQEHLRQGLCVHCDEPWEHPSRRHCAKHRAASMEGTRAHRRRRMVNTMGTTLEREKEFRIWNSYGDGGVTAWKRDKGCCVLCDLSYADRAVYVHHLDSNRKHNTADNLVCLCYSCHRLVHGLSEHPHLLRFLDWFHTHYPASALPEKAQALLPRQKRRPSKPGTADDLTMLFTFTPTTGLA